MTSDDAVVWLELISLKDLSRRHPSRAMDMESSIYDSSSEEETEVKIPICIRHPGWTNLILVFSYCLFGIAFLTTQQQWHPATALYVVVQIVTTIGYGDITVTDEEKIFMTLYVLLGTVVVAKVVNDVSEELLGMLSGLRAIGMAWVGVLLPPTISTINVGQLATYRGFLSSILHH